jgi:PAS domain S-box-containing protein
MIVDTIAMGEKEMDEAFSIEAIPSLLPDQVQFPWQALIENMPTGFLLVEATGRIRGGNRAMEQMMGISREQATAADFSWFNHIAPDYMDALQERMLAVFARPAEEPVDPMEVELIRVDGTRIQALLAATRVPMPGAELPWLAVSCTDITALRARERELDEERTYWHDIVETVHDGVVVLDSNGLIHEANRAAQEMFDLSIDDVRGASSGWIERVAPEDLPRLLESARRLLEDDDYVPGIQVHLLRRDGSRFPVTIRGRKLKQRPQWEAVRFVDVITDLTELETKNQELERASRAKSEFLANMSHELRTPLNAIIGFSEALLMGDVGEVPEEQQDLLQEVHRAGVHLLGLVNDILDIEKVAAGRMKLFLERARPAEVLDSALAMVQQQARNKQITLSARLSLDDEPILLDGQRVKQMALNYLSNALKFTPLGGEVVLTSRRVPRETLLAHRGAPGFQEDGLAATEYLEVSVCDNGPGIEPADQQRLFRHFEQADSTMGRRHQQGTGLGLVLVKSFAELHGGTAALRSTPGEGSCFYFWLAVS